MSQFDVGTLRLAERQVIGMTQMEFLYAGFAMPLPIKSILLPVAADERAILLLQPISLSMLYVQYLKREKKMKGKAPPHKINDVGIQKRNCDLQNNA